MSTAASIVHDDRFWPDNGRYLPSCREVAAYLDERAVVAEHAIAIESPRGIRRRTMWSRISGIRPKDPVKRTTTKWFRRPTSQPEVHPKYTSTRVVASHEPDGSVVVDVKRHCSKAVPPRQTAPPIDHETESDVALDAATTEVVDGMLDTDVVSVSSTIDRATVAHVVVPPPQVEVVAVVADYDDPVLLECIGHDADALPEELPLGCYVDEDGSLNRRAELANLAALATIDPDWA